MLPGKRNLFHSELASLIGGFLRAAQLFSPNPLSCLHTARVDMLLFALVNTAASGAAEFLQQDFTKSLSELRVLTSLEVSQYPSGFLITCCPWPASSLTRLFKEGKHIRCISYGWNKTTIHHCSRYPACWLSWFCCFQTFKCFLLMWCLIILECILVLYVCRV